MSDLCTIIQGDCLTVLPTLPAESVQCVVTSPPYWGLRDYGTATWEGGDPECDHRVGRFTTPHSQKQGSNAGSGDKAASHICPHCGARRIDNQLGLEPTPELYVEHMVAVFREVRRVLHPSGTVWLNLGSSYFSGRDDMMELRQDLTAEEHAYVLSELSKAALSVASTKDGAE